MLRTIFVPLDGSPLAKHALPYAESLAAATSAGLVLSRVLPLIIIESAEQDLALADAARTYLAQIADRLSARGRTVANTLIPWGKPAACLLDQVGPARPT